MNPFDSISDMTELRLARRGLFDAVATLYDQARPPYPETLVDDLVRRAGLGPDSKVLEIGCGTGQLTVALAERGLSILAVELGAHLAECAKQKLTGFANVAVVVADFDDWTVPQESFDLVVAATAFHWLNPSTRVNKCVTALRPGGTLGIVETHWSAGSGRDRFFVESQACYARWEPQHDPSYEPQTLPATYGELETSEHFEEVRLNQYESERHYDTAKYCELLATFSNIRALDERNRSGLLRCIADLIDARFDGCVTRKDLYRTWLARTRIGKGAM